jgi:tetratricopeptide (TPR) repeat protein/tRNA A-37 threonylcarbamoyl transferase component Bud32
MNPSEPAFDRRRALAEYERLSELEAQDCDAALAILAAEAPALAAEVRALLAADAASGVLDRPSPLAALAAEQVTIDRSGESIGAYRLIERVGRGGMGDVYRAERENAGFKQTVAVKLLRRGLDSEDLLARFAQERRILARLNHPSIARLIDGGATADGAPYLVMEFVAGETLTDYAARLRLPLAARIRLVMAVCEAVDSAHRQLVVHRDLKPANVLVIEGGEVKLLDFGIAKVLGGDDTELRTHAGVRVLTPAYAAPEQHRGEAVGTAVDVYALGVILHELLTGTLPHFDGGDDPRATDRIARAPSSLVDGATPAQLRTTARELSGDLDTIVLKALHPEPTRRYPSALALADDLLRFLDGRPIEARPDTLGYRVSKFVQRHRGGVTLGLLSLLGIVVAAAVALWQAREAQIQTAQAQQQLRRAEAIKDFTLSLFREQDPFARGKPVARSGTELVGLGIERARREFASDTTLRDDMLLDLGEIDTSLGEYARAISVLRDVVTARRDGDPLPLAQAQGALAAALLAQGDYAEVEALLDAAVPVLETGLGRDAPRTLRIAALRVRLLTTLSRNAEALPLAQDLAARSERVFGADAPETLVRVADVATVEEQMERLDAALVTHRDVLARIERVSGPEHLMLARPLARMGDILRRQRKYDGLEPIYDRAIAIATAHDAKALLGPLLLRRGDLRRRLQNNEGAGADFDAAAALLPPASPELAQVEMYRGGLYRAQGRLDDAAQAFLRSYHGFKAALGPKSPFAWSAALEHVGMLRQLGRGTEAEPLLLEAVAVMREVSPAPSFDVMLATGMLGAWRAEQGRIDEALALYREAVASSEGIYGVANPSTIDVRLEIVSLLLDAKRRDEAERELVATEALLKTATDIPDTMHARATELRARVPAK